MAKGFEIPDDLESYWLEGRVFEELPDSEPEDCPAVFIARRAASRRRAADGVLSGGGGGGLTGGSESDEVMAVVVEGVVI